MSDSNLSVSDRQHYQELGEYWDAHSLAESWDQTEPVEFDLNIQSNTTCYALEPDLSRRLRALAHKRGVSAQTLLNLWVQEKVAQFSDASEEKAAEIPTVGAAE